MMRRPAFWVAFTVFAVACAAFAAVNFPRAFSIVELELEMDRATALSEAGRLGNDFGWGPPGYRQAASFRVDGRVRNFVELEGGGPEAFARLLADGPFHPYQWVVRHFREGEVRETEVRFRPDGAPYGFRERLSEDEPGVALDPDAARAVAENGTGPPWNVALDRYEPVETSQEERPGGRVDHTFVYEPDRRTGRRGPFPPAPGRQRRPDDRADAPAAGARGLRPPLRRDALGQRGHLHRRQLRDASDLWRRWHRRRTVRAAPAAVGAVADAARLGCIDRLRTVPGRAEPVASAMDALRHGDFRDRLRDSAGDRAGRRVPRIRRVS